MIEAFGPAGQRVALDMSTVRALVEGEQVQRVYVAGEPEPFTVTASYDAVLLAWQYEQGQVDAETRRAGSGI